MPNTVKTSKGDIVLVDKFSWGDYKRLRRENPHRTSENPKAEEVEAWIMKVISEAIVECPIGRDALEAELDPEEGEALSMAALKLVSTAKPGVGGIPAPDPKG